MSKEKNGGSAFPCDSNAAYWERSGMSLRDYFAAKAMQVFLSNPDSTYRSDAQNAYAMADAMINERKVK